MSFGSGQRAGSAVFLLAVGAFLGNRAFADSIRVQIKGLAFIPPEVSVRNGDTVEWVNDDFVAHTATARSGAWDLTLGAHASAHTVISGSGTIDYYCRFHPNMKGKITVKSQ